MNKKIIFLIGYVLIFCSFVSAAITSNNVLYYSYDNDNLSGSNPLDLSSYSNNGTNNGLDTGQTGILNQSFLAADSTDYISVPDDDFAPTTSLSIATWVNHNSLISATSDFQGYFTYVDNTDNNGYMLMLSESTSKFRFYVHDGVGFKFAESTTSATNGDWYHVVGVWNGSDIKIYVNGTLEDTTLSVNAINYGGNNQVRLAKYGWATNNYVFDGYIDETGFWSEKALTQGEITLLASGFNPYIPIEQMELTAINIYDGSTINNFNATFINSSDTTFLSTTNGTIYYPSNQLVNITIENNYSFNSTYNNYDTTNNLQATLANTNITFDFYYHNSTLRVNDTLIINDTTKSLNWSTNLGYLNINPIFNQSLNFNFNNKSIVYNNETTFNFSAREINNYNIYFEAIPIDVTFLDISTGLGINNTDVEVYYPSGGSTTLTTNESGSINIPYIVNDAFEYGNYTLVLQDIPGYITPLTVTFEFNESLRPLELEYNVTLANIIINIYDRETGAYLTEKVDITAFSLLNDSTSNGTYNIQNASIIAGDYLIQASSDGYLTEQKWVTYTSQENATVDFYLLNATGDNTALIYINVLDDLYRTLPDATVSLYEYDPVSLSYTKVSESYSNANGEAIFGIELNIKTYYFTASKTRSGNLYSTQTSPEIIKTADETRTLILTFSPSYTSSSTTGLIYSITDNLNLVRNKNTNDTQINVSFITSDNFNTQLCVYYYQILNNLYTLNDQDCYTGSSGSLESAYTLPLRNVSYSIKVYQIVGDLGILLFDEKINAYSGFEESLNDEELLQPLILVPFTILISIALYSKKIYIWILGAPISSWILLAFFPSIMLTSIATLITLQSLILLALTKNKSETQ